MIKKLLVVVIFFLTIGSAAATNSDDMGNKYVVSHFTMSDGYFTALITNQNGGADNYVPGGTWELSTSPAANHENVLLKGEFAFIPEELTITGNFLSDDGTSFTPTGTTYYLIVYTNYDDHDNRVSKTINSTDSGSPVNT